MNNIKINISKDPKFGYSNLSFSEKPTEEMQSYAQAALDNYTASLIESGVI